MMKKVLSLMIAMAIMLPFGSISHAESKMTEQLDSRYEVLKMLKIINFREAEMYTGAYGESDVFKDISKSAFINYVCNIYADYGFTEVYNEEAIRIAEENGLIHREQLDLNKPLYYEEAITILVRLLGYGIYAEKIGGFPHGYITVANRLSLNEGVSSTVGQILRDFEAVALLYNVINCPVVDIAYISSEDGIVYESKDKTLLDQMRGIYRIKGIVEGTASSSLVEGYDRLQEGYVKIDGYNYRTSMDCSDYLGFKVEAYVEETKSGEETILVVLPVDNIEITIQAEDMLSVSSNIREIQYYDEQERERKLEISPIVSVIYNGQPTDDYTKDDFFPKDGTVRLIDNDQKDGYDVAIITNYKTVVVESVSATNKIVQNIYTYDEKNVRIDLDAETYDTVRVLGSDGEIEVSALKPGDVLKIASSQKGSEKFIVAQHSNIKVSGVVTAVRQGKNEEAVLNDQEYVLSKSFKEALIKNDPKAKKINPGKEYTFYLDCFGEVAYVQEEGAFRYAIPMAIGVEKGFKNIYQVKLYTDEGKWQIAELADKIAWNDEEIKKTAQEVASLLPVATSAGVSVIGYTLAADGKIKSVNLPETYDGEGNNDKFNVLNNFSKAYRPSNKSFESVIYLKDQAKIFSVDKANVFEEDAYSMYAPSSLVETTYTIAAYCIDEFGLADIIVVENNDALKDDAVSRSDVFVVSDVLQSLDSKGDNVIVVEGIMGKYEMISFTCDDPSVASGLEKGDIIVSVINEEGKATKIKKYRSSSELNKYEKPANLNMISTMIYGKVDRLSLTKKMMRIDCGDTNLSMRLLDNANVIIYDSELNKVYMATADHIENGDIVSVQAKWSKGETIIIYR